MVSLARLRQTAVLHGQQPPRSHRLRPRPSTGKPGVDRCPALASLVTAGPSSTPSSTHALCPVLPPCASPQCHAWGVILLTLQRHMLHGPQQRPGLTLRPSSNPNRARDRPGREWANATQALLRSDVSRLQGAEAAREEHGTHTPRPPHLPAQLFGDSPTMPVTKLTGDSSPCPVPRLRSWLFTFPRTGPMPTSPRGCAFQPRVAPLAANPPHTCFHGDSSGPGGRRPHSPVCRGCRHRQSVSLTPTVSSRLSPCASGADITFTPRSPSQCHLPRDELTSPAFLRWTRWQPFSCPSVSAPNAGPASCLRSQTTKRGSGHHEIQRKTGQATVTERRTQKWH